MRRLLAAFNTLRSDRGDAGLPLLLITPALLFVVLHLVNASQQLYERREAFSVASAAARIGNQADQTEVRRNESAVIDTGAATAQIQQFVADEGFTVTSLSFDDDRSDGTVTVVVGVERQVDYIFPIPGTLSGSVSASASSVLNRGVSAPDTP